MSKPDNQISSWLEKLERESWQLELLVSAFTIFLLIGANAAYNEFLTSLNYQYNMTGAFLSIISIFLIVIRYSILALTITLIIHLTLRGFWIGTIGLRSVQPSIDFEKLNYTSFFTNKVKKRVVSLDKMVVQLDEICSVIFAFSFLIISMLVAIGGYFGFIGVIGIAFSSIINALTGTPSTVVLILFVFILLVLVIMGFVFMLDYFTLGFFKKIRWFGKVYYPFYRLFNIITLSGLSRSIYYYLISKFTKQKIRWLYALLALLGISLFVLDFDQHQYFPSSETKLVVDSNTYDDQRLEDSFVEKVSIPSNFIDKPFFPLFIRYDANDNVLINVHCPDFEPMKEDGLNFTLEGRSNSGGFTFSAKDYSREDFDQLLSCQSAIYQISVNDSIYSELVYRFYTHPSKEQKGLLTVIPTDHFIVGENVLSVKKIHLDTDRTESVVDYAFVPFWFNPK